MSSVVVMTDKRMAISSGRPNHFAPHEIRELALVSKRIKA